MNAKIYPTMITPFNEDRSIDYNGVAEIIEWGKKRLAYEVQKMREGFYYFIPFTGDSETPNELESQLRIMEPVIRYLVVKPEAETEAPVAEEAAPAEEKAAASPLPLTEKRV